jgi:hypothetical protein
LDAARVAAVCWQNATAQDDESFSGNHDIGG